MRGNRGSWALTAPHRVSGEKKASRPLQLAPGRADEVGDGRVRMLDRHLQHVKPRDSGLGIMNQAHERNGVRVTDLGLWDSE